MSRSIASSGLVERRKRIGPRRPDGFSICLIADVETGPKLDAGADVGHLLHLAFRVLQADHRLGRPITGEADRSLELQNVVWRKQHRATALAALLSACATCSKTVDRSDRGALESAGLQKPSMRDLLLNRQRENPL
jgi:hypothetical protein